MKKCSKCKLDKPFTEFHKSSRFKDGHQAYCKSCNKQAVLKHIHTHEGQNYEARKARNDNLRNRASEFKRAKGCACCIETEPACLEFHHLDPELKVDAVSNLIKVSWDKFLQEAAKCVLLCANCHRKVHLGLIKLPSVAQPDQSTPFGAEGS